MAVKKNEDLERVVAIKAQMDEKVAEIHELEQEETELKELMEVRIAHIKASFDDKINKINTQKEYLIEELKSMFMQVPSKETKTQAKVALLSGDVIIKKPTVKFEYDKKVLLANADKNGLAEYVTTKVVKDFNWTDFEAKLSIQADGTIINTETGELLEIDGLSVLPVAEQVVVK